MFVFRVKHLLLVCFLSIVFIYFASIQETSKSAVQITYDGRDEDALTILNDTETSDEINRFIDKYINENSEKYFESEDAVTTEEALVYLYLESDSSFETEENVDNANTEIPVSEDDSEMLDSLTDSSEETTINDHEEIPSKAPPKKSFTPKEKDKKLFTPKDNEAWANPPSNILENYENNNKLIEKGASANVLAEPKLPKQPLASFPYQDPLPVRPLIIKEEQDEMKKDSPIVALPRDKYWPPVLQPSDAEIFSTINYTKYDPEDRAYLLGRVGVYEERARVVGEVCRNNPHLIRLTPTHTFVWDQRHDPNLIWCEISKVASTSWMANFLRLGHYRENDTSLSHLPQEERDAIRFATQLEDDNVHFRVLRLFPAPNTTVERREVFSKALRFIIVRHPFSRLLSAYQDKMTTLNPIPKIYNFRQLQLQIIERYRGNNTIQTSDPQFPTFGEFIQYVIDSTAMLKTLKDWRQVACWQPYWAKCGVCAHDFQLIMKLETMVDDEHFLVTLAGLHELDKVFEWRHSQQTSIPKEEFFRQLSTDQVHQLHQRYLLDFQLFGYSIHQYLDLAYDAPKHTPTDLH